MEDPIIKREEYILRLKDCALLYLPVIGKRLEKGEIHPQFNKSRRLKSFLEEYCLQEYLNEFLILASLIQVHCPLSKKSIKLWDIYENYHYELVATLSFLFSNDLENICLSFYHASKKSKALIQNKYLIKKIRSAILEIFIDYDRRFKPDNLDKKGLDRLVKYLDHVQLNPKRKGRPYKNMFLSGCILEIYIFLQFFTQLKASKGTLISRRQASFIYTFLRMFGMISSELAWEEDNIRLILKKYIAEDYFKRRSPEQWLSKK